MPDTHAVLIDFQKFLLIFLRTLAVLGLLPVIGGRAVPAPVKVGLAAVIAYLIVPTMTLDPASLPIRFPAYAFLAVKETAVGLVFGFISMLLFMGVQATGQMLGIQMGFGIGQIIDPQLQSQVSLIGQLEYILAVLVFLAWDGHHFFLTALRESFDTIPLTRFDFQKLPAEQTARIMSDMIILGVKIAAPVIVVLLLVTILFALVARVVPRMNVFILTFPVSIGVGLLTLGLSLGPAVAVFKATYTAFQVTFLSVLHQMGP